MNKKILRAAELFCSVLLLVILILLMIITAYHPSVFSVAAAVFTALCFLVSLWGVIKTIKALKQPTKS